jgi:hypothetical protein
VSLVPKSSLSGHDSSPCSSRLVLDMQQSDDGSVHQSRFVLCSGKNDGMFAILDMIFQTTAALSSSALLFPMIASAGNINDNDHDNKLFDLRST